MLDFNNNRNNRKPTQSWKPNNSLLSDLWVIELKKNQELKKEIEGFPDFSENESRTYTNLWETMKEVLRGKLKY